MMFFGGVCITVFFAFRKGQAVKHDKVKAEDAGIFTSNLPCK